MFSGDTTTRWTHWLTLFCFPHKFLLCCNCRVPLAPPCLLVVCLPYVCVCVGGYVFFLLAAFLSCCYQSGEDFACVFPSCRLYIFRVKGDKSTNIANQLLFSSSVPSQWLQSQQTRQPSCCHQWKRCSHWVRRSRKLITIQPSITSSEECLLRLLLFISLIWMNHGKWLKSV